MYAIFKYFGYVKPLLPPQITYSYLNLGFANTVKVVKITSFLVFLKKKTVLENKVKLCYAIFK